MAEGATLPLHDERTARCIEAFGTPRVFASLTSLGGAGCTATVAPFNAAVRACCIQDECERASMIE